MSEENFEDDQFSSMTIDEIKRNSRLLDNEIRIIKEELQRTNLDLDSLREKVKENQEKIKLSKQLPYLVGNIVEILEMNHPEEEDGANIDLGSQRKGKCVVLKTSTRQVSINNSSCKRRRARTRYLLLPQDIVFQFLLHVPAQPLYDVVRHVCREWSLIISSPDFARHHRSSTCGGVVIQPQPMPRKGFYLEMRRGRLEVSDFDCGFDGMAVTSCNGLMVITDRHKPCDTFVVNPLTRRSTALPPPPGRMRRCGLSFAEASMVYKVALLVGDGDHLVPKTRIALLTVGVDRVWRHIDIRHLWITAEESRVCCPPLCTGGYVHWASLKCGFILTLNLETETACRFSSPPLPNLRGIFLAMGSNLSFVHSYSEILSHVWEMDSATGEWTLLFRIRIPIDDDDVMSAKVVTPMCWLMAREILIYYSRERCGVALAYNCRTGEIQSFEWKWRRECWYRFQPHVKTLLWWERE